MVLAGPHIVIEQSIFLWARTRSLPSDFSFGEIKSDRENIGEKKPGGSDATFLFATDDA